MDAKMVKKNRRHQEETESRIPQYNADMNNHIIRRISSIYSELCRRIQTTKRVEKIETDGITMKQDADSSRLRLQPRKKLDRKINSFPMLV